MSSSRNQRAAIKMEYKWEGDDAWYDVGVLVNIEMEILTIKFTKFSPKYDLKFSVNDFKSEAELTEFATRFRCISDPVQDNQCTEKIIKGLKVCAVRDAGANRQFYDAIVTDVHHKEHSLRNGKEECNCTFVVEWLHGPSYGDFKDLGIGSICTIVHADQFDPRFAAFLNLAREKINQKKSNLSENGFKVDVGSEGDPYYFILIGNMEKDILAKSIRKFIKTHTSVGSDVYVFPCQHPEETFVNAAIVVDSKEKLQDIYNFLMDPSHFVVSTLGRPWVILEHGSRKKSFESFKQDSSQTNIVHQGLTLVPSDREAYRRAERLRRDFLAFVDHQRVVHKRLECHEKETLQ